MTILKKGHIIVFADVIVLMKLVTAQLLMVYFIGMKTFF